MDLPVKKRIYTVLLENKNGFLNYEEIAQIAYGDAYVKATKKHLNGLIKRNVQHGIAMLTEDGYMVIKDLQPTSSGSKLSYKGVNGYKIADKEDIDIVKKNLKTKNERLEIASQIRLNFEGLASKNNLMISNE